MVPLLPACLTMEDFLEATALLAITACLAIAFLVMAACIEIQACSAVASFLTITACLAMAASLATDAFLSMTAFSGTSSTRTGTGSFCVIDFDMVLLFGIGINQIIFRSFSFSWTRLGLIFLFWGTEGTGGRERYVFDVLAKA
jgi:hypothetical protein